MNNINFRSPLAALFLAGYGCGGIHRAGRRPEAVAATPVCARYHAPVRGGRSAEGG
jgi:hypothetical protein